MHYQTTKIELPTGLRDENDVQHREVILREMIVKDLLAASNIKDEEARAVHILAQRVLKIGAIENPGMALIEKLNLKDYGAIIEAANNLDG